MQIVNKTHLYTEQISVDKVCIGSLLLPPYLFCISPQLACKVTYLVSRYGFGNEMTAVRRHHLPLIFSATTQDILPLAKSLYKLYHTDSTQLMLLELTLFSKGKCRLRYKIS